MVNDGKDLSDSECHPARAYHLLLVMLDLPFIEAGYNVSERGHRKVQL